MPPQPYPRVSSHGIRNVAAGAAVLACLAVLALPAMSRAETFTSATQLAVPSAGTGPGTPVAYPSAITVSGKQGPITHVSVSLTAVSHTNPDDLDVALVGPNGAAVHLMSDACANDLTSRTLTFDDSGFGFLSDLGACPASGNPYKPSNYDGGDGSPADIYIGAGPLSTTNALSAFNGIAPNGAWSLFVQDDAVNNTGTIDGWSLTLDGISNVPPPAPVVAPPAKRKKCKKKKRGGNRAALAKKKRCKKKKRR